MASLLNVASEHWSACQVFNETILPACLDALAKYPKDQQGLTIFDNTEGMQSHHSPVLTSRLAFRARPVPENLQEGRTEE